MDINTMSGLDHVKAIASGQVSCSRILDFMPINIVKVESGHVVFHISPEPCHSDFMGKVHCGYAATILDAVTALATRTLLSAEQSYDTLDLSLKVCQSLPCNQVLIAEAKIVNQGRKLVIAEGSIKDKDGNLYAYATSNYALVKHSIKA